MRALKNLARDGLALLGLTCLCLAIKSDTGRYRRPPLYERAVQNRDQADAPTPSREEARPPPPLSQDIRWSEPTPEKPDPFAEERAARAAYLAFSAEVGKLAAKDLADDVYATDDPKAISDWLIALLTKACGMDESRCSIAYAASCAQEAMEERVRNLQKEGRNERAYVLAEAMAPHADKESRPKPVRGIDVAIQARDVQLASRFVKEQTEGKEDEASAVLALVSSLEGKHLDMPDVLPGIDKQDPGQGVLIRKALRHQYRTIKEWRLPLALAEGDREEAESLQETLAELESVNTLIGFL